jgi:hypothetical protein
MLNFLILFEICDKFQNVFSEDYKNAFHWKINKVNCQSEAKNIIEL